MKAEIDTFQRILKRRTKDLNDKKRTKTPAFGNGYATIARQFTNPFQYQVSTYFADAASAKGINALGPRRSRLSNASYDSLPTRISIRSTVREKYVRSSKNDEWPIVMSMSNSVLKNSPLLKSQTRKPRATNKLGKVQQKNNKYKKALSRIKSLRVMVDRPSDVYGVANTQKKVRVIYDKDNNSFYNDKKTKPRTRYSNQFEGQVAKPSKSINPQIKK